MLSVPTSNLYLSTQRPFALSKMKFEMADSPQAEEGRRYSPPGAY